MKRKFRDLRIARNARRRLIPELAKSSNRAFSFRCIAKLQPIRRALCAGIEPALERRNRSPAIVQLGQRNAAPEPRGRDFRGRFRQRRQLLPPLFREELLFGIVVFACWKFYVACGKFYFSHARRGVFSYAPPNFACDIWRRDKIPRPGLQFLAKDCRRAAPQL